MKLGILVNTDRHPEDLIGVAKAAISKGHEVTVFFMDDGVKLLNDPEVNHLCDYTGVNMSYCDYTTRKIGMSTEDVCSNMICGSQFDNATMNHDSDRVIVL